ncbi:hypothetical protein J2X01_002454 [Arthrobacter ginsengisoli]|uniref:XRE family transcriptional regulator n=1 Tax=Arthrobacter ginsengisoli TaxID=1356565 RepID=A0ABU1UDB5_9MICC|nr:hypothetical protein [Arthrobacter ginsengisoli]
MNSDADAYKKALQCRKSFNFLQTLESHGHRYEKLALAYHAGVLHPQSLSGYISGDTPSTYPSTIAAAISL